MKALAFNYPTCSVLAGEPCRSVGALQAEGTVMQSFHIARRRLVPKAPRPNERHIADRVDGYDRDDLGPSGD